PTGTKWVVTRLQASGSTPLDSAFGTGGVAVLEVCSNQAGHGPSGIAPAPSSRLAVAGSCGPTGRAGVVRLSGGVPFPAGLHLTVDSAAGAAGHERIPLSALDPSEIVATSSQLQPSPIRSSPIRSSP